MESDTCFCETAGFDAGRVVQDEEEQEDEQEDEDVPDDNYILHSQNTFMICPISRPCVLLLYLIIVLLILASSVSIVVVGILVVSPFHGTNYFEQARCSPERIIRDIDRRCSCGKGCNSQYPCVIINARVYVEGNDLDYLNSNGYIANISDDEVILSRQVNKYFHKVSLQ